MGARYHSRPRTFQVDRATLDAHVLDLARAAGCEVWRPGKVARCDLEGASGQWLGVNVAEDEREVRCSLGG